LRAAHHWTTTVNALPRDTICDPRRGMSRDEAARYVGAGATKFDEMVFQGAFRELNRRLAVFARSLGHKSWIEYFTEARYAGQIWELDAPFDISQIESSDGVAQT
jgi:hypothetical protein